VKRIDPELPIGVFDSGVGGITVLRALRASLPRESTLYLGDTARVPYGTKSPDSVLRYSLQASDLLVKRGIKLLVVACNTASALSLDRLREHLAPLPVIGVVEPGAEAAVASSERQRHLVLATEATVSRRAYTQAIRAQRPQAHVEEVACSLLVSLAEEGWTEGPIAESVVSRYVASYFARAAAERPDTIILGCTHFPLLSDAIRAAVGPGPQIIDSASTTARFVAATLEENRALASRTERATLQLLATDGPSRFARLGARFLGESLEESDVELVDL
jgi:glutamate racemase